MKKTICRWYADFKRGRTNTKDAERPSGRPTEVATPENTKKNLKIILSDRKVKLQEIANILKISKGTVFKVVHENLSMKKLYSKWVPRLLTVEQRKQQRIHDSECCLKLFTRNKKDFSLPMHAKPSFAHRLQIAKMASSRTSAQNNGPRARKNGPWV